MSEINNEIIAKNKVERFVSRFEDSYYLLACHVAVPLAITPELVNYLRIEFLRNERVPWIAEADLLLSDLCKKVGYELYVMHKDVRTYLLKILAGDSRFGEKRIREICRLLLSYINRTYAKTPYIAHDNFDELHYSHVRSPNYFYSKTFSFSSQITFILIEGCFNWSVRYFDNNPCLT